MEVLKRTGGALGFPCGHLFHSQCAREWWVGPHRGGGDGALGFPCGHLFHSQCAREPPTTPAPPAPPPPPG